ncbi:MAG: N-acetylmuramoyl-L-alanine amidase [Lachnospiraceae bacterium]|nr:N-acetylmuramoyl-L-alanine amidase [Lachnospiraceae bacterium]
MLQKIFKRTTVYSLILAILSIVGIVILAGSESMEADAASLEERTFGEGISASYTEEADEQTAVVQEAIEDILETDSEAVQLAYSGKETVDEVNDTVMFVEESGMSNYLEIPLPSATEAKDILFENHYMEKELRIIISKAEESFYRNNVLSGNSAPIVKANFEEYADRVVLIFETDDIYEYKSIMSNGSLYISFMKPREIYDRIIVIDPACGGMDSGNTSDGLLEKDINLKVVQKLKEKLDKEDIKVYYTRLEDVNPTLESRMGIANDVRADMFIQIRTDGKKDSSIYGVSAIYNGEFFIPGFGNEDLANILVNEVSDAVKSKALGIENATEGHDEIKNLTVPAALISLGCISNPQEAILFTKDDYIEKICDGLYNAIMKAYEAMP